MTDLNVTAESQPDPRPFPGTYETHSFETIDNDRAPFMFAVGIIR